MMSYQEDVFSVVSVCLVFPKLRVQEAMWAMSNVNNVGLSLFSSILLYMS